MSTRLWVLGASDPEMESIERILTGVGEMVVHAGINHTRVHPGNAYRADVPHPIDPDWCGGCGGEGILDGDSCSGCQGAGWNVRNPEIRDVYLIECDIESSRRHESFLGRHVHAVDHHRPGDPGYGLPPADFWRGSSLGQVMAQLEDLGLVEPAERPSHILMTAAADHCLSAAYAGLCPGIDPAALGCWRAESRAAFQRRPVEAVLADVEAARDVLRNAATDLGFADLRGRGVIPELPEAAAREGIPFLAEMSDRDGRRKVVLQSAGADLIRQFLDGNVIAGLVDRYGDPERGFAGGYLAAAPGDRS